MNYCWDELMTELENLRSLLAKAKKEKDLAGELVVHASIRHWSEGMVRASSDLENRTRQFAIQEMAKKMNHDRNVAV